MILFKMFIMRINGFKIGIEGNLLKVDNNLKNSEVFGVFDNFQFIQKSSAC